MRRLTREGPFASKPRLDVGECLVGSCKHLPVEGGRHSDPGRAWEQVRPETLTAAPKHHSLAVAPEKDQHAGLGPPGGVRGVGASWHEGRPDRQRHERSGSLLLPGFSHSGKSCQEAELKRGSSLYMCHTELAIGLMSPWSPPPRLPLCPLSLALTSCGSGASRLALCAERIQAPVGWVGVGSGAPGGSPWGPPPCPSSWGSAWLLVPPEAGFGFSGVHSQPLVSSGPPPPMSGTESLTSSGGGGSAGSSWGGTEGTEQLWSLGLLSSPVRSCRGLGGTALAAPVLPGLPGPLGARAVRPPCPWRRLATATQWPAGPQRLGRPCS